MTGSNKNIRDLIVKLKTSNMTDICKEFAKYDPDHEMNGTKSRKEFYKDVKLKLAKVRI
jgi:hypothetical protein